jgi:alpha-methylacyl-CoA racemase
VVDASITDGAASLTNFILGLRAQGLWERPPGQNLLDTGAPFYDIYRCADGKEVAVGALEPAFYGELLRLTGQDPSPDDVLSQARRQDPRTWPEGRQRWAQLFSTRSRDEWTALLADSDACVAPVLSLDEAAEHPHLVARSTYAEVNGIRQASPAPRFSRTVAEIGNPAPHPGDQTDEILTGLGMDDAAIARLRADGVVA